MPGTGERSERRENEMDRKEYPMDQTKIDRINELARKSRTEVGLTPAEKAEQAALRQEYVAAIRANLTAQLDSTVIQYPDGTRKKLKKKRP